MAIRINNVKASLDTTLQQLEKTAAELLVYEGKFKSFRIVKKAVDARNKNNIHFVYALEVEIDGNEDALIASVANKDISKADESKNPVSFSFKTSKLRPVVVGSGPGGMLAGIALAEAGLRPIILERGREVSVRRKDVASFWKTGVLDETSNVQFGEGGAGTFSDGKLMSGIKKDAFTAKVLKEFVEAGAPEEILYLAKPHIGTDNLVGMVQNIRKKIESLGGEYRFENRLSGLVVRNGKLAAIKVTDSSGKVYEEPVEKLILAIGHSARDTFEMLYASGMVLECKPFAVGARIEHLQSMVNRAQYGKNPPAGLGAADYKLAVHLPNGRSAYTFCMCPGGQVVAAASEAGRLVTNGMSEFARDKKNANSALLVGLAPNDFAGEHPLRGMYFQREIEEKAFRAGGADYRAPAQLVGDFLKNRTSERFGEVMPSYAPGVRPGNLENCLPEFVTETMRLGIAEMDKKLHGFASYDAVLTGVESRSSSPVRILRDENFESSVKGLYPCGEGAGYAGGIMSAAADGLKCAKKLLESLE